MREVQAHEVEARNALDCTAAMHRHTVRAEYRQIDPIKARMKAGAPEDIGHPQGPVIMTPATRGVR